MRALVRANVRLSRAFDRLLPADYRIDGNLDFARTLVPAWLGPGQRVVDVGGGTRPCIAPAEKARLGLHVTGVDISAAELDAAPAGAYDRVLCADITRATGAGDADVCICRALLEHVPDTGRALRAIAGFLRPGGVALVFVPSRNAAFARLNLALPERAKRALLFALYPAARRGQGFPSHYHRCTPRDLARLAEAAGLEVVERRCYYVSAYFTGLAPLHVLWRAWIVAYRALAGPQAAETFSLVLRRAPVAARAAA